MSMIRIQEKSLEKMKYKTCRFHPKEQATFWDDEGIAVCIHCAIREAKMELDIAMESINMVKEFIKDHPEAGLEI